jgi:hypothetical protein
MRQKRSAIVLPFVTFTCVFGTAACAGGDNSSNGDGDPDGYAGEQTADNGGSTGNGSSGGGNAGSGAGSDGASQGGSGANAGEAGQGGSEPQPIPPGPPVIESITPIEGPFGTLITINGAFLGSPARAGAQLRIGVAPAFTIFATGDAFVESWTEDAISFRYPFPAEGALAIETPQGIANVGDFTSTWRSEITANNAPAASVIASISGSPKGISLLFDSDPPVLLELGPEGTVTHQVTLNGAVASSVRLYLAGEVIEAIGVTEGDDPELVHFTNVEGDLVGALTGIQLDATETAFAGGPDGACAWLHRSDGWYRARPVAGDWTLDAGPIADVQTASPDRTVGASSDGSLYVAWSVDAGNWFDDMEAPRLRRLDASGLVWGDTQSAGSSVDDYVTSLEILDKGRGVVVRYCGSDNDPWGVSSTSYRCYDGLHTPAGAFIARVEVDVDLSRHAFSAARAVAGYCDGADTFRLRTDTDTAPAPDVPIGEAIVYPCQSTLALELDPQGDFVPVVRRGTTLHLLGRRPVE